METLPLALYVSERTSDRFWAKVVAGPNCCWIWTGSRIKTGYGRFAVISRRPGRLALAHRYAWVERHGEVPPGLHVLHRCDNPPCVNPDHLFVGTHMDNMLDMIAKGRKAIVHTFRDDACRRGHSRAPENISYAEGTRRCLPCRNEHARIRYAARRGRPS